MYVWFHQSFNLLSKWLMFITCTWDSLPVKSHGCLWQVEPQFPSQLYAYSLMMNLSVLTFLNHNSCQYCIVTSFKVSSCILAHVVQEVSKVSFLIYNPGLWMRKFVSAYSKTRNGLRNGLIPRTPRKWKYALISCQNDHFAHCPSIWTLPATTTQL